MTSIKVPSNSKIDGFLGWILKCYQPFVIETVAPFRKLICGLLLTGFTFSMPQKFKKADCLE